MPRGTTAGAEDGGGGAPRPLQAPAPPFEHRHLTVEIIARSLAASPAEPEPLRLIEHLAASCAPCRTAFQDFERLLREVGHSDPRVAVFEGRQAPDLWRELEPLAPADRLSRARLDETLHTWALYRLLQRKSLALAHDRPAEAAELASLALAVWSGIHRLEAYGAESLADLRAELLACHAHALRGLGELHGAAAGFDAAAAALQGGSGDPRVQAGIDLLTALLRHDQHRDEEAFALLDRAFEVYGREGAGDASLAAETLATRAWCLRRRGRPAEAVPLLAQATEWIEHGADPRLAFGLREELVADLLALGASGRARESAEALAQMERLELGPFGLARTRRAQGRVAASEERWAEAEAALSHAAGELARQGRSSLATLTRVELAGVRAAQGVDPARLAAALDPDVAADEFNALQMITFFSVRDACRDRALTPTLARELADRLELQGVSRPPWATSLP